MSIFFLYYEDRRAGRVGTVRPPRKAGGESESEREREFPAGEFDSVSEEYKKKILILRRNV